MSTVKANTYQDASGGNTATINSMTPTADSLQGFRNRIINGDMRIDQRNAGASITVNSNTGTQFPVDRFLVQGTTSAGVFTAQQSTSTPPSGFVNFVRITTTTASASPASGALYAISQIIEGNNIADLGFGAAGAKTVTFSFWVRSSLTGTFSGSLKNGNAYNRSYPFTYSISAANTWEYKTVTVTGDTSGTWETGNLGGLIVYWDLGCGSSLLSTANSWQAGNFNGVTGSVRLISNLNATLDITGVQLEVGSTATPFERRPYGTELALCQRYCYSIFANQAGDSYARYGIGECIATTVLQTHNYLPVVMRTRPSVTTTSTASNYGVYSAGSVTACSSAVVLLDATTYQIVVLNYTVASGLTLGRGGQGISNNNTTSYLIFSAEL